MTQTTEKLVGLGDVLERTSLWATFEETARFYASRLEVRDEDGRVLRSSSRWPGGAEGSAVVVAVSVLGRKVGEVAAWPDREEDAHAAGALARHVASVLGEVAVREYELNDLSREILESYEEVNLFYDISSALAAVHDVEGVCGVILAKACEIVKVNRSSILLLDEAGGELYLTAAMGIPSEERDCVRIPVGTGISGKVLETRVPQLVDDVGHLPTGLLAGYETYTTRSFISVPLCVDAGSGGVPGVLPLKDETYVARGGGRAIGVINMTDKRDGENFTAGDLKLLTALASQAAVLIENMRLVDFEKEMRIARRIQRSLLPEKFPEIEGLQVAGALAPARILGGDLFDFIRRAADGVLCVVVADVSGHSIASAMMMAVTRSALRSAADGAAGPSGVLRTVNRMMYEDLTRAELFVSGVCLFLDPRDGSLRVSNAGHPPGLLLRTGTSWPVPVDADGLLVGIQPDCGYSETRETLRPGDSLLVYTDGIIEAADDGGRRFGVERLARSFARHAGSTAAEGAAGVLADARAFAGGFAPRDDMTVVVLKAVRWRGR